MSSDTNMVSRVVEVSGLRWLETAKLDWRSVVLRRKSWPFAVVVSGPTTPCAISRIGCRGNGNVVCDAAGLEEGLMRWHVAA